MPGYRQYLCPNQVGAACDLYFVSVVAARRVRMVVSNGD
jgi:hypothetical protein